MQTILPIIGANAQILLAFIAATLPQTLLPGPTMLSVLSQGTLGAALRIVIGVSIANLIWSAIAILVTMGLTSISPLVIACLTYGGACYLVFMATRLAVRAVLDLATGTEQTTITAPSKTGRVVDGVLIHGWNPYTAGYFLSVFNGTAGQARYSSLWLLIVLGVIATALDGLVYSLMAVTRNLIADFFRKLVPAATIGMNVVTVLALTYFIVISYRGFDITISLIVFMLFGFAAGLISEAYALVRQYQATVNRPLWRTLALWQAWFGLIALGSAVLALRDFGAQLHSHAVGSAGPSPGASDALPPALALALRLMALVCALVAATLAVAKAMGELQDEGAPQATPPAFEASWRQSVVCVGLIAMTFAGFVFGYVFCLYRLVFG
jgi:threonine/homoserine/homoserine lactone efflux protein